MERITFITCSPTWKSCVEHSYYIEQQPFFCWLQCSQKPTIYSHPSLPIPIASHSDVHRLVDRVVGLALRPLLQLLMGWLHFSHTPTPILVLKDIQYAYSVSDRCLCHLLEFSMTILQIMFLSTLFMDSVCWQQMDNPKLVTLCKTLKLPTWEMQGLIDDYQFWNLEAMKFSLTKFITDL